MKIFTKVAQDKIHPILIKLGFIDIKHGMTYGKSKQRRIHIVITSDGLDIHRDIKVKYQKKKHRVKPNDKLACKLKDDIEKLLLNLNP